MPSALEDRLRGVGAQSPGVQGRAYLAPTVSANRIVSGSWGHSPTSMPGRGGCAERETDPALRYMHAGDAAEQRGLAGAVAPHHARRSRPRAIGEVDVAERRAGGRAARRRRGSRSAALVARAVTRLGRTRRSEELAPHPTGVAHRERDGFPPGEPTQPGDRRSLRESPDHLGRVPDVARAPSRTRAPGRRSRRRAQAVLGEQHRHPWSCTRRCSAASTCSAACGSSWLVGSSSTRIRGPGRERRARSRHAAARRPRACARSEPGGARCRAGPASPPRAGACASGRRPRFSMPYASSSSTRSSTNEDAGILRDERHGVGELARRDGSRRVAPAHRDRAPRRCRR